ncbi:MULTISPECIES: LLM class flavin-dependent oxidoreductase [Parafrankia]|uniref:Alkanesulfonate monooxygenase n=1 Tax=Parafrankia soli TaxID=2599596 RepID=A0A1S1PLE9_9ACTN|nr:MULTISPECIES: LLM class flavin-dependent oxidoreductase [Parafrankia]OHV22176.1 alkanesulfonate monooxygenase [Parafrankia soli]TCJ31426.1 LLM class flavin-dependent oxidoreductase [Parafrankia sp. BMG5.11]
MTIEIIGMVGTKDMSETRGTFDGPVVDTDYLTRFAQAHDEAGFDRVLIGYGATGPDGWAIASHVLYSTQRLGVLIAHRPGFVAPTLVARKLATLDALTGGRGRVAIHHITGGSDTDQRRDGDFADHDTRYERTAEFMSVLRRALTSEVPFDHEGPFYRFEGAFSSVRPTSPGGVPLFFGGQSAGAVAAGSAHADVYMLFGEPLEQTAERIALLRAEAAKHGRTLRFSLSTRPIVADTEEAAWERAEAIRAETARRIGAGNGLLAAKYFGEQKSIASDRMQDAASRAEVHDERLWFAITALTGPGGNSSGHVGTPEQVAEALLKYYDLGIDRFLIRGFDPLDDVRLWGGGLVPALRAGVAARDAGRGTPVAVPA